jgi:hypothetical protein
MSSFVVCFQFDLIDALSCVICLFVMCILFVVPYYITTTTRLTTHLQSNNNNIIIMNNTALIFYNVMRHLSVLFISCV